MERLLGDAAVMSNKYSGILLPPPYILRLQWPCMRYSLVSSESERRSRTWALHPPPANSQSLPTLRADIYCQQRPHTYIVDDQAKAVQYGIYSMAAQASMFAP